VEAKDPFDSLIRRLGEADEREFQESSTEKPLICRQCHADVVLEGRFCPYCGEKRQEEEDFDFFLQDAQSITKRLFQVSLIELEADAIFEDMHFTRVYLRTKNLSRKRLNLSLTYADSVIIDNTGRQYSSLLKEDIPEGWDLELFDNWFFIYPGAHREGNLLFRAVHNPIRNVIISATPQDNEEELFIFRMDNNK
jgi:RNA polymerase subunit RPABC4/transcription elongation factor Spt4